MTNFGVLMEYPLDTAQRQFFVTIRGASRGDSRPSGGEMSLIIEY